MFCVSGFFWWLSGRYWSRIVLLRVDVVVADGRNVLIMLVMIPLLD